MVPNKLISAVIMMLLLKQFFFFLTLDRLPEVFLSYNFSERTRENNNGACCSDFDNKLWWFELRPGSRNREKRVRLRNVRDIKGTWSNLMIILYTAAEGVERVKNDLSF